ncbi:MAG: D-Ala-D-Ala carboxypeptidase family metallohydrolase [Candidatus Hodarchaeales archaeon]
MSKYFSKEELYCPCCKKNKCTELFLERLEALRVVFGMPMSVNSCYRCDDHNKNVGGALNSYHAKGMAIDIKVPDSQYRAELVHIALNQGLSVGIYSNFVHIDIRDLQTLFYGKY